LDLVSDLPPCGETRIPNLLSALIQQASPDRFMALVASIPLIATSWTFQVSASDSFFSRTSGAKCELVVDQYVEKRICAGLGEYSAVITNRDNVMQISFDRLSDRTFRLEADDSTLIWRGATPYIGERIEWHMQRGGRLTAIVRIFTLDPDDKPMQQFLVAKITSSGSCEIARIDASDSSAYETARDIAESQVGNVVCGPFRGRSRR
jgi:hypothetical protein